MKESKSSQEYKCRPMRALCYVPYEP